MDKTEVPASPPPQKYLSVRQAAYIRVGSMVGAGAAGPSVPTPAAAP